jgi:FkbM family methyltransferase
MQTLELQLKNGTRRNFSHRGTKADMGVIQQIFVNKDYSLDRLRRGAELRDLYRSFVKGGKTPLIIDAGANIGASVCWFAIQYPECRIVAVEPDARNFDLLTENVAGLNVELHDAAIGSHNGRVSLIDPGEGEWGYRTELNPNGACRMISISQLVQNNSEYGFVPFIAKIDIEGGEGNLFQEPNDWVNKFPLLIVELHDWLLPKQKTSQSFLKCISKYDRDFVCIGENIFSIRND